MSASQPRTPAGAPTGGQFAGIERPEAAFALSHAPSDLEIDYSYPYPQANDLDKVALVPDAIAAGADTDESIAVALGLGERQGAYYGNAAAWLGLATKHTDDHGLGTWRLTDHGRSLAHMSPAERADALGTVVGRVDDVELVRTEGKMALQAALEVDGLSPTTAGRRADCMDSWASQTQAALSAGIADGSAHLGDTLHAALLRAGEQRSAARHLVPERPVQLCPAHFTQLSNSGVCDECELDR